MGYKLNNSLGGTVNVTSFFYHLIQTQHSPYLPRFLALKHVRCDEEVRREAMMCDTCGDSGGAPHGGSLVPDTPLPAAPSLPSPPLAGVARGSRGRASAAVGGWAGSRRELGRLSGRRRLGRCSGRGSGPSSLVLALRRWPGGGRGCGAGPSSQGWERSRRRCYLV